MAHARPLRHSLRVLRSDRLHAKRAGIGNLCASDSVPKQGCALPVVHATLAQAVDQVVGPVAEVTHGGSQTGAAEFATLGDKVAAAILLCRALGITPPEPLGLHGRLRYSVKFSSIFSKSLMTPQLSPFFNWSFF